MEGWLWWVIAAFVLAMLEIFSLDLVFGALVVAALAAAGVSVAGGGFVAQALTASAVAVVMLVAVRPLLLKRLKPAGGPQLTGSAALVGRRAEVVVRVTDRGGRVKLAGEEWTARSARAGTVYEPDELVQVLAIDGATAVVTDSATDSATEAPEGVR